MTEVVLDGEFSLTNVIDGECGVIIRAGEESPLNELYGIWVDIVGKYLGRDALGHGYFTSNKDLSSQGQVVNGYSAVCEAYIPVDPGFTYAKNEYRMTKLTFYDENKNFISQDISGKYDTNSWATLVGIPLNCRYIRFCTNLLESSRHLQIIRMR